MVDPLERIWYIFIEGSGLAIPDPSVHDVVHIFQARLMQDVLPTISRYRQVCPPPGKTCLIMFTFIDCIFLHWMVK